MSIKEQFRVCQVCGAKLQNPISLELKKFGDFYGQRVTFFHCDECGFTSAPENLSYPGHAQLWSEKRHFRAGNADVPGREFYMAVMGYEIMQLACLQCKSILLFGSGGSLNHVHLRKRFPGVEVCICDLENSQNSEHFISLDSNKNFDIVVACEVVEHFTDITGHFSSLLGKASEIGLVIISTNINDGEDLDKCIYPFIPGHTSYYSGKSLRMAIENLDEEMAVDFRVPHDLGTRKRYAICYKDRRFVSAIPEYFSTHFMAPSEKHNPLSLWMKLRRFGSRLLRFLKIKFHVLSPVS